MNRKCLIVSSLWVPPILIEKNRDILLRFYDRKIENLGTQKRNNVTHTRKTTGQKNESAYLPCLFLSLYLSLSYLPSFVSLFSSSLSPVLLPPHIHIYIHIIPYVVIIDIHTFNPLLLLYTHPPHSPCFSIFIHTHITSHHITFHYTVRYETVLYYSTSLS